MSPKVNSGTAVIHLSWSVGVLIIFSIFILTFRLADSASVIDYIGFASTLISIVLGLVAIFYSFVTSSQSSQNIGSLTTASEQVNEGAQKISDISNSVASSIADLNKLSSVLDNKLERVLYHSVEMNKKFIELDKSVKDLALVKQSPTVPENDERPNVNDEVIKNFILGISIYGFHAVYAAYLSHESGKKISLKTLAETLFPDIQIKTRYELEYHWGILEAIDAINLIDKQIDSKSDDIDIFVTVTFIHDSLKKHLRDESYLQGLHKDESDWKKELGLLKNMFA